MAAIPLESAIFYPESDGEPMAESELHMLEMMYVIEALRERFEEAPDVYVGGDLFLYFERGRRDAVVAPDAFVVQGVPKLPARRKYLLWEEGKAPCFVLEVTSDTTQKKDLGDKKSTYQRLGVDEYFLFDPLGDYLKPRLQGYRLGTGARYRAVTPEPDGSLASTTLGLTFRPEGTHHIRLIHTATGEPLLRREELTALRRQGDERIRALEEELARLRGQTG
jgi:Uma2 family endonuclease